MAQVNYFGANDLGTECCSDKRIKECFHSCCESAVQSLVVEVPCQNNSLSTITPELFQQFTLL